MLSVKPKENEIVSVKDIPGLLAILAANNFNREDCQNVIDIIERLKL